LDQNGEKWLSTIAQIGLVYIKLGMLPEIHVSTSSSKRFAAILRGIRAEFCCSITKSVLRSLWPRGSFYQRWTH